MRKLIAAVVSLSLAAAPATAQPPQGAAPTAQDGADADGGGNMKGELWGYLALPALIVVILLIAVLRGEDEDPISP